MGMMLHDEKIISFFERIQCAADTQEQLGKVVESAVSDIAEEMHIGKVEVSFTAPYSRLRASIDNLCEVLYQCDGRVGTEVLAMQYTTGDGGKAVFSFYPLGGHVWTEAELREIRVVGNQIFMTFSQVSMSGLLSKTLFMDLKVEIPNITGFMKFVESVYEQGLLPEYDAFYINIHNFKYVNKVLPYGKADEVMKMYARKLADSIGENECVARLGGDNFVALIRKENVARFLENTGRIDIVYVFENQTKNFSFGSTVGGAHLDEVQNPGEVMNRISIAYQVARRREHGDVIYYDDDIYREVMAQKEIIAGFERALKNNEFVAYYQPKVITANKTICGAEALVRWMKPEGMVPPIQFIPVLEKEGSICLLDFYMLEKVCDMLSRSKKAGIPLTQISVNFSRKHMEDADLVRKIVDVIDSYGIPHEYLEIELTESENYKDYEVMSRIINGLKQEGIGTSIDDFGTGYSSLNMLKMTNADLLKIDKSFIPMDEKRAKEKRDVLMFEYIANMAKDLGFKVIAEGVETEEQYEYLKSTGCDMIQGYYFDKPLPEADFWKRMVKGYV